MARLLYFNGYDARDGGDGGVPQQAQASRYSILRDSARPLLQAQVLRGLYRALKDAHAPRALCGAHLRLQRCA